MDWYELHLTAEQTQPQRISIVAQVAQLADSEPTGPAHAHSARPPMLGLPGLPSCARYWHSLQHPGLNAPASLGLLLCPLPLRDFTQDAGCTGKSATERITGKMPNSISTHRLSVFQLRKHHQASVLVPLPHRHSLLRRHPHMKP